MLSLFFLVYSALCLSFIVNFFVREKKDFIESITMRIGVGILAISPIALTLDLVGVPLNYIYFMGISTVFPIASIVISKRKRIGLFENTIFQLQPKELVYAIVVILMTAITCYMYVSGSFSYTYFEDNDPWFYSAVVKNIADAQTIKAPYRYNHYSEPYTQGYQVVMAMLYQANGSINWTMKFFHNFILGLSISFFYYFVKSLFADFRYKLDIAFFSTVTLFAIPSWVSHFIFSLSYNMVIIVVALYFLAKIDTHKNYKYILGFAFCSIILNHFFTAFIFLFLLIVWWLFKSLYDKKPAQNIFSSIIIAFLLSLVFYIPTSYRHFDYVINFYIESHGGLEMLVKAIGTPLLKNYFYFIPLFVIAIGSLLFNYNKTIGQWWNKMLSHKSNNRQSIILSLLYLIALAVYVFPTEKLLFVKGSASRLYDFKDFFVATSTNMINNPVGWGYIITVFCGLGFLISLYKCRLIANKGFELFISLHMFIMFFMLVHGMRFSIVMVPFRQWTFLALFAAIMCGLSFTIIIRYIRTKWTNGTKYKGFEYVVAGVIAAFMIQDSFIPKYQLNVKVQWPESQIVAKQSYELYDYVFSNLPKNTRIINACKNSDYLVAYDMAPPLINKEFNSPFHKGEDDEYFRKYLYQSNDANYTFLKKHNIDYVVLSAACFILNKKIKAQDVNVKINSMGKDKRFKVVKQVESAILFKVLK